MGRSHVVYNVNTVKQEGAIPTVVERRYSDFEWLRNAIKESFSYVIVPPLPGKQATGNLDPIFIEYRRVALQKFLGRCSRHAALQHSAALHVFLEADQDQFEAKKKTMVLQATEADPPAPKQSWFGRMTNAVTNATTTIAPDLVDETVREKEARFRQVSYHMHEVKKASERLMFKQVEMAEVMNKFAEHLRNLGEIEPSIKDKILAVAEAEDVMSKEYDKHAGMMAQLLDEPFQDHLGMLEAAQDLGKARNTAALNLTNARMSYTAKETEVNREKQKGTGSGRLAQLDVELNQLKQKQDAAQKLLDKFKDNMESEVTNFHNHRVSDLKHIMAGYASAAHKLATTVAKQRAGLATQLDEIKK